jgi:PAS domain S-box-containing protein
VVERQLPPALDGHTLIDLVMLAGLVPAIAAFTRIPPQQRPRSDRLRGWLGFGIVIGSVLLFCRSLVIALPPPPVLGGGLGLALEFLYPISHITLACVVWLVLLRVGTQARLPLFFVTAGLIVYSWVSVYWAYHGTSGSGYAHEVIQGGSAWCFLLITLAALSPHAADPRQPPARIARARYIGLQSLIVYLPVVTSTIVVAVLPRTFDPLVIGSGLLVLVLFGVRLTLLSVDNSRLAEDLEGRVDDLVQRSSELRRLMLQHERIVQSVVDGVIVVDAEGLITFVNPAAAAMLQAPRQELIGRPEHEIFHGNYVEGREPLKDCCVVAIAMSSGTATAGVSESFIAADGRVFPVELAVGPILEDDRITGAVVVFRDVSERREIEKMKNEFVSVVSHELRTPLTSIRGSLGLLAGGAAGRLSLQGERMVSVALESSERLTRLINDMLDIERIESGTIPVQLTECEPELLMGLAVDAVRGLSGQHRIEVSAAHGLPEVRADADRIVQVLTNLIGNAIKFSPLGSAIRVGAQSQGALVEFAVADDGRGIPVDKISRIFERFEQVDSSDSREKGGTGLGLAISRTIVRRHGGELWATSQPGVGSVFRFTLPTVEAESVVPADALARPGGQPLAGQQAGRRSILPDGKTDRLAV